LFNHTAVLFTVLKKFVVQANYLYTINLKPIIKFGAMIDRFLLLVGLLGEAPALLRGRIQLAVY
jgi:hypothetical protein